MKERLEQLKTETLQLKREAQERVLGYILAAFGVVAGLAWNEAIKGLIELIFPASGTLLAKFVYAIAVTLIVVFVTVYLTRLFKESAEGDRKS